MNTNEDLFNSLFKTLILPQVLPESFDKDAIVENAVASFAHDLETVEECEDNFLVSQDANELKCKPGRLKEPKETAAKAFRQWASMLVDNQQKAVAFLSSGSADAPVACLEAANMGHLWMSCNTLHHTVNELDIKRRLDHSNLVHEMETADRAVDRLSAQEKANLLNWGKMVRDEREERKLKLKACSELKARLAGDLEVLENLVSIKNRLQQTNAKLKTLSEQPLLSALENGDSLPVSSELGADQVEEQKKRYSVGAMSQESVKAESEQADALITSDDSAAEDMLIPFDREDARRRIFEICNHNVQESGNTEDKTERWMLETKSLTEKELLKLKNVNLSFPQLLKRSPTIAYSLSPDILKLTQDVQLELKKLKPQAEQDDSSSLENDCELTSSITGVRNKRVSFLPPSARGHTSPNPIFNIQEDAQKHNEQILMSKIHRGDFHFEQTDLIRMNPKLTFNPRLNSMYHQNINRGRRPTSILAQKQQYNKSLILSRVNRLSQFVDKDSPVANCLSPISSPAITIKRGGGQYNLNNNNGNNENNKNHKSNVGYETDKEMELGKIDPREHTELQTLEEELSTPKSTSRKPIADVSRVDLEPLGFQNKFNRGIMSRPSRVSVKFSTRRRTLINNWIQEEE